MDSLGSRSSVMYVLSGVVTASFLPKFKKQDMPLHENVRCTTKPRLLTPVNGLGEVVLTTPVCIGKAFYASFRAIDLKKV